MKGAYVHLSTVSEWLDWIGSVHQTEIELGLERIHKVAMRLGLLESNCVVITVGGTNGKGSVVAGLEAIYLAAGYHVGVFTSPFILTHNEQVRVDGTQANDESFCDAFAKIESARSEVTLTPFEYHALAALMIFKNHPLDVMVLEVGLGGRLDATNIVDCDIALVTTVDLDHQAFLGDTREKIGFEKAGIMRENTYAVVGDLDPPQSVLKHAETINAKLLCREQQFSLIQHEKNWSFSLNHKIYEKLNVPYIPIDNVATALTVLSLLEVPISSNKINTVIKLTKVAGRTELFVKNCDVLLDVGHNPQAARYLANYLKNMNYNKIFAVVGMLADKDITNALSPLIEYVDAWYLGSLHVNRGAKAQQLSEKLNVLNESVNCFDNVTQAFKMASSVAGRKDLILVYGSFYTVTEIRRLLV